MCREKTEDGRSVKCMMMLLLLSMQILNQRAIEASEKERPTPDIRTGDIVEIKLVFFLLLKIYFEKSAEVT